MHRRGDKEMPPSWRRLLCSVFLTAISIAVLAGCGSMGVGGQGRERVRLMVWSPSEDQSRDSGEWLQKCCGRFAEQHPEWDITFVYGIVDESLSAETMTQDPEAGADVFLCTSDSIASLRNAQVICRFGGKYAEQIRKECSDPVIESVTQDEYICGVPFSSNTWFMYYDRRVFSEEDVKSLDTMLQKGMVSFPLTNPWYLSSFYLGNGCTLFGDGTQEELGVDFGGENAVEVTEYLVDLAKHKNFTVDSDGSGIAGMRDGSIKAMFSGVWDYKAVREILGENLGAAAPPSFLLDGVEKQMYAYAGTKIVAVNTYSDYMVPAVELAVYLGSAEAQKLHYELRSVNPCALSLMDDPVISADPVFTAQNDTIERASILQPSLPAMQNCWGPVENMGKLIRNGSITHANAKEQTEKMNTAMNRDGIGTGPGTE